MHVVSTNADTHADPRISLGDAAGNRRLPAGLLTVPGFNLGDRLTQADKTDRTDKTNGS